MLHLLPSLQDKFMVLKLRYRCHGRREWPWEWRPRRWSPLYSTWLALPSLQQQYLTVHCLGRTHSRMALLAQDQGHKTDSHLHLHCIKA